MRVPIATSAAELFCEGDPRSGGVYNKLGLWNESVDMMFNIADKQITFDHQLWNWLFSCKFVALTDRVDRVIGVKATFSVANLVSLSLWLSESESGSSTAKEEKNFKLDKLKSISPVSSTADPTDYKHQTYLLVSSSIRKEYFLDLFNYNMQNNKSLVELEVGEEVEEGKTLHIWSCHFCFQPMK